MKNEEKSSSTFSEYWEGLLFFHSHLSRKKGKNSKHCFFGIFQDFSDVCCCYNCSWNKKRQKLFQSVLRDHESRRIFDFISPCNDQNSNNNANEGEIEEQNREEEEISSSSSGAGFSNSASENEIVGEGLPNIIPVLFKVTEKETKHSLGVVKKKTFSIFDLKGKTSEIDQMSLSDLMASFGAVLEKLTSDAMRQLQPTDQIQAILSTESGVLQRPVSTKLTSVKDFDSVKLLLLAQQYFQSNETDIKLADGIRLEIVTVKITNPSVSSHRGGKRHVFLSVLTAVEKKTSCIRISNSDNLCMSRCIAVALVQQNLWEKIFHKKVTYRHIRNSERPLQKRCAMKVCDRAGITYSTMTGVEEAKLFEKTFNVSIKIFDAEAFLETLYAGCPISDQTKGVIYLLKSESETGGHYDLIVNITKFLGKRFYCAYCSFAYDAIHNHCCSDIENWCYTCYRRECQYEGSSHEKCSICFRKFRNESCAKEHSKTTSNCKIFKCFDCGKAIKRKELSPGIWENNNEIILRHGECKSQCSVCDQFVDENHVCFMKREGFKKHVKKVVYLDFETDFSSGQHIPVYCYISWIFQTPEGDEKGNKEFGISDNVSQEVGSYLFAPFFKHSTVIAHNLRGFDGCFLLRYLVENNIKPNKIITDGTKITYLVVSKLKIRLIDSLNLIPLRLDQFSSAFGLEESDKGMFPFKFIRSENFQYVGPFPDKQEFGYFEMNEKKQKEFDSWYSAISSSDVFDFDKELKKYCIQDVKILESGVEKFRELIKTLSTPREKEKQFDDEVTEYEITDDEEIENENSSPPIFQNFVVDQDENIDIEKKLPNRKHLFSADDEKIYMKNKNQNPINCDPISYCTLASLCHALYKAHFLKKNSIALIPAGGYLNHKYSDKSIEWMEFLNFKDNLNIIHKLNSKTGAEIQIGMHRVDGFDKNTKTIFEFHGCFFHGHPDCISNMTSINPVSNLSYQALFKRTKQKERMLRNKGYEVITKWECEWNAERQSNEVKDFLKTVDISPPINPKDAFFGGRVETFKMLDCEGEKSYVDVTSLYPFVISRKMYPVGHPVILLRDLSPDISNIFGFVKCKVLPPKKLIIPVLPVRVGLKLQFPLCNYCVHHQIRAYCTHDDSQRMLSGTWFSEELKLAVEKGYQIINVLQALHFNKQSSHLFTKFINSLYKIKLLASGKPEGVNFDSFLDDMLTKEGIDLRESLFEENPGMRYIAKILLNSFWGRFAMTENKPQFKFVSNVPQLYSMIENENIQISALRPITEKILGAVHSLKHETLIDISNDRNIYIAALTTAYARMELFKYCDQISTREKTQVLYVDTDGIIFNRDLFPFHDLKTGPFLGELTNELDKGEFIASFASLGPKNYSYVTSKFKSCIKVKGFSLHAINKIVFENEKMCQLITAFVQKHSDDNEIVQFLNKSEFSSTSKTVRHQFAIKHSETPNASSAFFDKDCFAISVYNPTKISRTHDWIVLSRKEQKLFIFNYDKRILKSDFSTIPFGFAE